LRVAKTIQTALFGGGKRKKPEETPQGQETFKKGKKGKSHNEKPTSVASAGTGANGLR